MTADVAEDERETEDNDGREELEVGAMIDGELEEGYDEERDMPESTGKGVEKPPKPQPVHAKKTRRPNTGPEAIRRMGLSVILLGKLAQLHALLRHTIAI